MVSSSKKEYLTKIKDRYRKAGRKGKKRILDEFCEVCGHHRKHAIRLLNADGRKKLKKPGRPSKYGPEEIQVLESIWEASGYPCSSRLVGMLSLWLPAYENRHGVLDESVSSKLLEVKARTLDDILRAKRKKHGIRGLSGTRPGTYLKNSIPLKISHKEVSEPGYLQSDTVAHCGGSLEGSFIWSLTLTDILTGWTENGAVWNKGQYGIHELLRRMEESLPFSIKGFHTDNGGEFVNHHLYSFYKNRDIPIEITRGRPGRSNDNPHVEQKNYTHVRKLLGYQRIEDESLVKDINELYEAANLLNNFFCSNRRLIFKERRGSKYYKKYDEPATPCQRLLASEQLTEPQKTHLTEMQINLDPYKLRRLIDAKLREIFRKLR
jgi:transposase InsO family protein